MNPSPQSPSECVLLDLDGTVLDTAPDMARALNRVRGERGLHALPLSRLRPGVSYGATGLIKLGFELDPADAMFEELRQRFLIHYARDQLQETTLFDGMGATLAQLEDRGIPWGIVTNKPGGLTTPLLEALGLIHRAACVVCGDTLAKRKPDPDPLLHASALIGVAAERCVYVGDALRDIQAGRRAGMVTLAASFGYLHDDDDPATWGADGVIDHPRDLLAWVRSD